MPYVFDLDRLSDIARERSREYRDAEPYPHVVIDDFLPIDDARALTAAFPNADDATMWDRYNAPGYEVKMGCGDETRFPEPIRKAIHDLNSGPFIRILEELTGIEHLLPDPHLLGGGMHMTLAGRPSRHPRRLQLAQSDRSAPPVESAAVSVARMAVTVGGRTGIVGHDGTRMVRRVEPLFNRMVLFSTRSDTFHGHPKPWAAPAGVGRKSIALYYYTSTRPESELRPEHSTLYKGYNA